MDPVQINNQTCRLVGGGASEKQGWSADSVIEKGADPAKGCKMQCEITGGTEEQGDQRASAGYCKVCRQGCSLIFILQAILLISLEGCPFPPCTPNPVRNHKRPRKVGKAHPDTQSSPGIPGDPPMSPRCLIYVKCEGEQDIHNSVAAPLQRVSYMQTQISQRYTFGCNLRNFLS